MVLKYFYTVATARALHIWVNQLAKCGKLQTLAKKYLSCQFGKNVAALGEFKRGEMLHQFDKIAFNDTILEHNIVKTKFGWHVNKVLSRT